MWREREGYEQGEDWWNEPAPPTAPTQTAAQQAGAVKGPTLDQTPNPQTKEAEPWWWDHNNGSPPSVPLGGGMQGWDWDGTRWWQTPNAPAPPPPPPPPKREEPPGPTNPGGPGPQGPGAVPSINVPSAGLPGDIQGLFNKQPEKTPIQSAYQDALLKFMGRSQETPSLDDPTLAPQVEVYRATQQRNQERNRRVAAERAAATGQSQSGYLDNLINKGVQEQNFNTAGFNANLLGGEMNKRRQELQAALQLASATGNQEAARELQARLAQISAMMQQQGLNLQGELGRGDLSLRLLQTLYGQDNFYDQLGVNTAMGMEGMNQRALQMIMGGM